MFLKNQKIHFIGIGGIGMSALACLMFEKGFEISGSDLVDSAILKNLRKKGIKIFLNQKRKNIADDLDLVIATLAIDDKNEEILTAKEKGLKVLTYPQALGEFTKDFELISVCGTHGKSTVTAMLADIFIKADLDPTVLLGTKLKSLDGNNYRVGKSKYFIMESCEYKEAFLNYHPSVILITNIDPDHLDYYGNAEKYVEAFEKYIGRLRNGGKIICNSYLKNSQKHFVKFGEGDDNDYILHNDEICFREGDNFRESDNMNYRLHGKLNLQIPGKHNRINALCAFALAHSLGIDEKIILSALNNFTGTWRRLEFKEKMVSGALLYDDYAHHPAEIKASLQAMRELYPKNKIIVVFQPHQYSRTKFFLKEFGKSFDLADRVIIPNIYKVRDSDEDVKSVSSQDLVAEISKHHKNAEFGDGFENTAKILKEETKKRDIVVIMGAGDIERLPEMVLKK
ncbi:UDP-N-acetylmuramate--L-alanine ligase [Candidatus Peregrinibacteria bacterium RIFOXYB2_FULL_32_7]|nr:MAG: UDP-N-acetylmuramate--L-alanine ligase [Candidatus Peregrinibacteria bacterium RIFOXYB2_FULL_32_7]